MAEPALPASTLVPALVRMVNGAGGFATVVMKGSDYGSALLLLHRDGERLTAYEKMPSLNDAPVWRAAAAGEEAVAAFIARQRRFDPDLWVLELDIADAARFVPGLPGRD